MKTNFIRDNWIWWSVKIIAACYQLSATYRVFHDNLTKNTNRAAWEVTLDSIFAILLIDALFLAVLYFLESKEISTYDKFPLVLVGICLSAAIIVIGMQDEGALAWMPRVGVIGLIVTDVFRWGSEVGHVLIERRAYRHSREYQEQQIRNEEVLARRKAMTKARKEAFSLLEQEFIQVQLDRERKLLGKSETPTNEPALTISEPNTVVKLNNGSYAWTHPDTGELVTQTATGKEYTERGARLAYQRSIKNNHHEEKIA